MAKKKIIGLLLIGLVVGLCVGFLVTAAYTEDMAATMVRAVSMEWRADFERRALHFKQVHPETDILSQD